MSDICACNSCQKGFALLRASIPGKRYLCDACLEKERAKEEVYYFVQRRSRSGEWINQMDGNVCISKIESIAKARKFIARLRKKFSKESYRIKKSTYRFEVVE